MKGKKRSAGGGRFISGCASGRVFFCARCLWLSFPFARVLGPIGPPRHTPPLLRPHDRVILAAKDQWEPSPAELFSQQARPCHAPLGAQEHVLPLNDESFAPFHRSISIFRHLQKSRRRSSSRPLSPLLLLLLLLLRPRRWRGFARLSCRPRRAAHACKDKPFPPHKPSYTRTRAHKGKRLDPHPPQPAKIEWLFVQAA